MTCAYFKLNFTTTVHFGTGAGLERSSFKMEADQLFSAVCHGIYSLYGKKELEEMLEGPLPFTISSAFPYAGETLFFPWPIGLPNPYRERFKTPQYLDMNAFVHVISGRTLPESKNACLLQEETLLTTNKKLPSWLWKSRKKPQVALDRPSLSSNIYHVREVEFHPKAGLFCLVRIPNRNDSWRTRLENIFRFLADAGIGGERSSGHGQFQPPRLEALHQTFPTSSECDWFVTLAPYIPRREELRSLDGYYHLEERGGWVDSPQSKAHRKQMVRMFCSGSTFQEAGQVGKLARVDPPGFKAHAVYRYGLPFKVGVEVEPWSSA